MDYQSNDWYMTSNAQNDNIDNFVDCSQFALMLVFAKICYIIMIELNDSLVSGNLLYLPVLFGL